MNAIKVNTNWKPVRRGRRYCSTACGAGCKYVDFQKAQRKVKKLVAALGPGWTSVVHENLGWHFNAVHPMLKLEVFPSGKNWWATTSTASVERQYQATGPTPRHALSALVNEIMKERDRCRDLVDDLFRVMTLLPMVTK